MSVILSAITMSSAGDGVAAVSRLLWGLLHEGWGRDCRVVTLCPGRLRCKASVPRKALFASRMLREQLLRRARWILFTHRDLIRVQTAVPSRLRLPYAVFLHGIEAWGALSARDRRLLSSARLRLANSRYTAARVMAMHPDIGPVVACPLALPPARPPAVDSQVPPFSPAERSQANSAPSFEIGPAAVLIVGRMLAAERYKGHDQLIDAWPRVVQQVPHAQLFVVGEGDDAERLRARAKQSPVAANVLFTGFASAPVLETLYRRCAVFAMPSGGEGFGLVYLEAMSHRLPCVGSRHDAASEIIADGETGLLVDQGDTGDIAGAIVRLLRDRDLRERMGNAGYRRVEERFSLERFSQQVTSCLREAFESSSSARPES